MIRKTITSFLAASLKSIDPRPHLQRSRALGLQSEAYPKLALKKRRCFVDTIDPNHRFTEELEVDYPERFIDFVIEQDDADFAPLRERIINAGGKMRPVLVPTLRDKIKGLHAYHEVAAWTKRYLTGVVYQGVPGRRHAVRRYRRAYIASQPLHTFECDIADFFGSVDHDILLQQFARFGPPESLPTVKNFLKSRIIKSDGHLERLERGIPLGNPLSHALAQLVLLSVDRDMIKACGPKIRYQRYADDILVFGSSKNGVRNAAETLLGSLHRLGLSENQDKTGFLTRDNEHDYLGYRFRDGVIGIPPRNILRAKKRIFGWTRPSRFFKQRDARQSKAIVKSVAKAADKRVWLWVSFFDLVTDPTVFRNLDRFLTRRTAIAISGGRGRQLSNSDYSLIGRFGPVGHYRAFMGMTHGSPH